MGMYNEQLRAMVQHDLRCTRCGETNQPLRTEVDDLAPRPAITVGVDNRATCAACGYVWIPRDLQLEAS